MPPSERSPMPPSEPLPGRPIQPLSVAAASNGSSVFLYLLVWWSVTSGGGPYWFAALSLSLPYLAWLIWLYRRYAEIRVADPAATKIPPGRAVGFMFIPIFNLVWLLWIFFDLGRALRRLQTTQRGRSLIWPYAVSLLLLTALIGANLYELGLAQTSASEKLGPAGVPFLFAFCIIPATAAVIVAQVSLNSVWHVMKAAGSPAATDPESTQRRFRRQLWWSLVLLVLVCVALISITMAVARSSLLASGTAIRLGVKLSAGQGSALTQSEIEDAGARLQARLEAAGFDSPLVQASASLDETFQVLFPAVDDQPWVRGLLSRQGKLELKEVVAGPFLNESEVAEALAAIGGTQVEVLRLEESQLVCRVEPVLTGEHVQDAHEVTDDYGTPAVAVRFTEEAGRRLRDYSSSHIGGQLAIVLDGDVVSAPVIQGEIGRDIHLTGDFSFVEAHDLALVLRAGGTALPAPAEVVAEEFVESRRWFYRQLLRTGLLALVLVVITAAFHRLGRSPAPAHVGVG